MTWSVIRTIGAGVHCGEIESRNGSHELVLSPGHRRIWRWRSGNGPKIQSCTTLAKYGPDPAESSVDEPGVYEITLTTVIEIHTMTDEAVKRLQGCSFK